MRERGDAGQEGFCGQCGIVVPDGPDACLGWLANVRAACCGHGDTSEMGPYVAFDDDGPTLRGTDALDYFAAAETVDTDPYPHYCEGCGALLASTVWLDGERVLCSEACPAG